MLVKWKFQQFLSVLILPLEYGKDFWRFLRFGKGSFFAPYERRLYYDLILFAHTIEKGLSLSEPRDYFGERNIRFVFEMLEEYPANGQPLAVEMSLGAIKDYIRFHDDQGKRNDYINDIEKNLRKFQRKFGLKDVQNHGLRSIERVYRSIQDRSYSYPKFLASRFSCRSYKNEKLDIGVVEEIVKIAQRAPSQCNRQSPRVHLYQDPMKIKRLLDLQGGSKGFDHEVKNLFVVSSEITAWSASSSRNQDYIDGSLFAMAVMYACHAKGIASCPLNLAFRNSKETKIRKAGNIPDSERLLMMIAFGYPNPAFGQAAFSVRKEPSETLQIHS
ncbi:MAG: nitroreductase family protein [Opitutales bacterium]|nr:nitroreductase family protein [Opitutales bacterium]